MSERLEKRTAQGLRTNESDLALGPENDYQGISQPAVPVQYKASNGQELQQEKEQHSGTAEEKYVLASATSSSSGGVDGSKNEGNPLQGKFQSGEAEKQQITQYKYQISGSYRSVPIQRMSEEEEPLQGKMGGAIQRMAEEEEPLQGKFSDAIQRMAEEEEPLQGKFSDAIQRMSEEDEPLQGKMSGTIQRMAEEEEPLQGKMSSPIQRMAEEEEPLQGKMNGPIQRMAEEEEPLQGKMIRPIQRKSNRTRTIQRQSATSAKLPNLVQSKMEGAMGADFSGVNIHTESQNATNVGALAYAQGNDVHFAPGQYDPQSTNGQELIGHELAHVVQQREGRVQPTTQAKGVPVNDDKGLEAEADDMGRKAAQMKGNFFPAVNYQSQTYSKAPVQAKSTGQADLEKIAPTQSIYELAAHDLAYKSGFSAISKASLDKLSSAGYGNTPEEILFFRGTVGFQAVLVLSKKKGVPSILGIRGTNPGSSRSDLETIYSDLDASAVGAKQFKANSELIQSLLGLGGGKCVVTGHSLGGAMAQHTAVNFSDMVAEVATFQSPGIDQASVDKFNALKNKPKVTHHIVTGDVVDKAGDANLAGDVYEHDFGLHLNVIELLAFLKSKYNVISKHLEVANSSFNPITVWNELSAAKSDISAVVEYLKTTGKNIGTSHGKMIFQEYSEKSSKQNPTEKNEITHEVQHFKSHPHQDERAVAEEIRDKVGPKLEKLFETYFYLYDKYQQAKSTARDIKQGYENTKEGIKNGYEGARNEVMERLGSLFN